MNAVGAAAIFLVVGLLSVTLRVIVWPHSIYGLITGVYPTIWAFLFPAFHLMPNYTA